MSVFRGILPLAGEFTLIADICEEETGERPATGEPMAVALRKVITCLQKVRRERSEAQFKAQELATKLEQLSNISTV